MSRPMNNKMENEGTRYTKKYLKYAKIVKSHGMHCINCCFLYDKFKCSLEYSNDCSISIEDDAHYEWNPIVLLLWGIAEHE